MLIYASFPMNGCETARRNAKSWKFPKNKSKKGLTNWKLRDRIKKFNRERQAWERMRLYLVNWITKRQTITPWTIKMDCLSVSEKTANENSWVILLEANLFKNLIWGTFGALDTIFWEFDPGSGRTLAACLTHASRTEQSPSGLYLVANGWVTREEPAFQWGTTVGNDC